MPHCTVHDQSDKLNVTDTRITTSTGEPLSSVGLKRH
jgi:hypothetical protein